MGNFHRGAIYWPVNAPKTRAVNAPKSELVNALKMDVVAAPKLGTGSRAENPARVAGCKIAGGGGHIRCDQCRPARSGNRSHLSPLLRDVPDGHLLSSARGVHFNRPPFVNTVQGVHSMLSTIG